ncbi:hypothetical protein OIU79_011584 [Salix purpurea]|uniref:Uncharacterized protein n=1 Tax=Salix purpurea TaxID=77065 RepID=A0A9Q0Q1M6_SALPP|nr:hypothetical protein OIU79_011584 [Salix purpurea]
MGRAPCCDKANVKRGPWSPEEDATLKSYLESHGTGGNWISLPQKAGLKRCGKSCRLRWLNYLRPNIKHGGFTEEEDNIICSLYSQMGSRQAHFLPYPMLVTSLLSAAALRTGAKTISNILVSPGIVDMSEFRASSMNSHIVSPSQEGSTMSDSSSLAMDYKGLSLPSTHGGPEEVGILMDSELGFPSDFVNDLLFQDRESEVAANCFQYFADYGYVDMKPQGLNQGVTNHY